MMVANMANGVTAAQTPPTMVIPSTGALQSPPALSALQPSPTERLHASSTSPTNTSGSDGSAVSGLDLAALIAATQQTKPDFSLLKQDPPIQNPLFSMPDASAILQFFQSQQAMLQAAAQRAAVQQAQQVQQQVQHQQQQNQSERKRSYPCTFQFCVICQKDVHSSKLPCHIRQCHVAKPMFQCPACDFTSTYSKNNVKSHMVSLHGLAGDPISYMDRYAPQVEEFMKMCFPNVRGRGRPMQGRGSPRSPASPQNVAQRRQSQTNSLPRRPSFVREPDLLALAQQQQQQQAQAALFAQAQSLNQLSIFPQLFNNNNSTVVNQNSSGMKTPMAVKPEPMEHEGAVVSSASSLDDMLQSIQANSAGSSRQMSIISTGSLRSLAQTVRPGENWQPRYGNICIQWSILNGDQVKDTIFSGLPEISEKIEGLDGEAEIDEFLKPEQQAKIRAVRDAIQMQTFEILFAIHRMDYTILKLPENLDRLISVAPSAVDAQKIREYQETNPNVQLTEDEQFLATLAQVKHLEEKLSIMRHMSRFDLELTLISDQLNQLSSISKALLASEQFKLLTQLVLIAQNSLLSCSTRGFIISQMEDICNFKMPSGQSILSLIGSIIKEKHSDLSAVFGLIPALEAASKSSFMTILTGISLLEENNTRADIELKESSNDIVAAFLESSQSRLNSVNEQVLTVKDELLSLLAFMAEPLPRSSDIFSPESFFRRVASFLRLLRDHVDQIDI